MPTMTCNNVMALECQETLQERNIIFKCQSVSINHSYKQGKHILIGQAVLVMPDRGTRRLAFVKRLLDLFSKPRRPLWTHIRPLFRF